MQQQKMNLNPEQMRQAAVAGIQLLQTPGAVSVPSTMAITGIVGTLNALLTAIVNGEVVIINAPVPQEADQKPELSKVAGGKEK